MGWALCRWSVWSARTIFKNIKSLHSLNHQIVGKKIRFQSQNSLQMICGNDFQKCFCEVVCAKTVFSASLTKFHSQEQVGWGN